MQKPYPQFVLGAGHLAAMEELHLQFAAVADPGFVAPVPPIPANLPEATEALRRIAYHRARIQSVTDEMTAMIAPLQAQIDQIEVWAGEQIADREDRIAFHESRLIAYYCQNPPATGKTLKLPGGEVSCREQQPEWQYDDEVLLLTLLIEAHLPYVRTKTEVNKVDIKKSATVQDGKVYVPTLDGEAMELPGVTVTERPPRYKVEVVERS